MTDNSNSNDKKPYDLPLHPKESEIMEAFENEMTALAFSSDPTAACRGRMIGKILPFLQECMREEERNKTEYTDIIESLIEIFGTVVGTISGRYAKPGQADRVVVDITNAIFKNALKSVKLAQAQRIQDITELVKDPKALGEFLDNIIAEMRKSSNDGKS